MNFYQILPLIIALIIILLTLIAVIFYYIKLKNSEDLWKFALEGAGDGVWDWDIKNDKAHFSDRYKEMLGFNDEDVNTNRQGWINRVHPEDALSLEKAVGDYLAGKAEKYMHEHRVICKDKSIKWVMSRGMICAVSAPPARLCQRAMAVAIFPPIASPGRADLSPRKGACAFRRAALPASGRCCCVKGIGSYPPAPFAG